LQTGLGVILVFVGFKMVLSYWYHLPIAVSLSFIALVLTVSIFESLRRPLPSPKSAVEKGDSPAQ